MITSLPHHAPVLGADFRLAALVAGGGLVGSAVAFWRRWSPPLAVTLAVGLVLRVAIAALAYRHTPHDVAVSFQAAGRAVLHGRDPLKALPHFQWNFLPFSAYLFAAEIKTGLSWGAAGKLLPIGTDLVTVVLLGRLAGPASRDNARLVYALSPVAFMIAAWHGQIEPIAVMLGLAALVVARRPGARAGAAAGAGILVALGAASKTWPVLFLIGVLRGLHPRRWLAALAAAAAVLLGFLLLIPVALHDSLRSAVTVLTSYRSYVGTWGWTGLLRYAHVAGTGYAGPHVDTWQRLGTALTVAAMVAAIVAFRRCPPAELTVAVFLAFLVVTAGFGPQYLLWPAALLCASSRRAGTVYVLLAGGYTSFFYLYAFPLGRSASSWPGMVLEAGSLAIVVACVAAMPWPGRAGRPRRLPSSATPLWRPPG